MTNLDTPQKWVSPRRLLAYAVQTYYTKFPQEMSLVDYLMGLGYYNVSVNKTSVAVTTPDGFNIGVGIPDGVASPHPPEKLIG